MGDSGGDYTNKSKWKLQLGLCLTFQAIPSTDKLPIPFFPLKGQFSTFQIALSSMTTCPFWYDFCLYKLHKTHSAGSIVRFMESFMPDHPLTYAVIDIKRCSRLMGLIGCHALGTLCLYKGCLLGCALTSIMLFHSDHSRIQTCTTESCSDPSLLSMVLGILTMNHSRIMYSLQFTIQVKTTTFLSNRLYLSHLPHFHLLSFTPHWALTSQRYTTILTALLLSLHEHCLPDDIHTCHWMHWKMCWQFVLSLTNMGVSWKQIIISVSVIVL